MAAYNLIDKGVPNIIKSEEMKEIKKFTKIKKLTFNFKNLVKTPKRKAWEWEQQDGMFGEDLFK